MDKEEISTLSWELDLGANYLGKGSTSFKVWAPSHLAISLKIVGKKTLPMNKTKHGYFHLEVEGAGPGDHYYYVLENGLARPDPVSRALPRGVHGPTEIVDANSFVWTDENWRGLHLRDCIFYETHVGTYTASGTFEGMIEKLSHIKDLGVNCIEIMPIAQFPGRWNWGYDGASLYTPFSGYGGARGLKTLVCACHNLGIAVCLDVVFNHLGPEGNYLGEFGPYFSDTYHTPWGKAFNYDGAHSDHVRDYIVKNAIYWIVEYHIDALRLDAIHGIYDFSASLMLKEMIEEVQDFGKAIDKKIHVIAESGLNDSRVLLSKDVGGIELCALWNDDFHHAAHVAFTGERTTYYGDYQGLADLAKALTHGFVYDGQYSPFRKKRHGNSSAGIPFEKFIVFIQNHDQVGNRPLGDRFSTSIGHNRLKVGACILLLTPLIPMIFMGEEYGEKAPFEYFVDFEDEKLMRSIYEGRIREFHRDDMPFPGKESFDNSKLSWDLEATKSKEILKLYRDLIAIRKKYPPKPELNSDGIKVYYSPEEEWLAWEYQTEPNNWIGVLCYLGKEKDFLTLLLPFSEVTNQQLLLSTQNIDWKKSSEKITIPSETALVLI